MTKENAELQSLPVIHLVPLIVDLWRLSQADIDLDPRGGTIVRRAVDRIRELGYSTEQYEGRRYDENLRVNVIEHRGEQQNRTIVECLSPAVFFGDALLKPADVITEGRSE